MSVIERFESYVQIDTRSVNAKPGEKRQRPSSEGQLQLAEMLTTELKNLGLEAKEFDDGSFLVHFPATSPALTGAPHVVYAAHMDTYYGFPGNATPRRHVYQGGDLVINEEKKVLIPASDLVGLEGKTIITSDGTTLLGADDKAGVAAMMEVIETLVSNGSTHGPLTFWFCVDEEIGALDVSVIPEETVRSWSVLWTLDGERLGSVDVGSFICTRVRYVFTGTDAHPGVSGDKLRPAHYAAMSLGGSLVKLPSPMETSGLEAFNYVTGIEGNASEATVTYMPRSFDKEESRHMTSVATGIAQAVAHRYGVSLEVIEDILTANTRPAIDCRMDLVRPGVAALKAAVGEVRMTDVRGGTDGGMLNLKYPDLPAPNLGIGGANLHGPQEFLVVQELEQLVEIVIAMTGRYTDYAK